MNLSPLFRFAVIADTHVNPSDADSISPFESHRLTNSRLDQTVRILNALQPEFVVHVGDMIHPVPEAVSYPEAVKCFFALTSGLQAKLYVVPGNHDTGDKPADYVPAGSIRPEYVELYSRHFGSHYYSFEHHDCHFVVINTSLINSGLVQETEQTAWLEADLAGRKAGRCVLLMHYPPFIAVADEDGHYDNIDEPGREWLLRLLSRHGVETVFAGHVHNFFFNRYRSTNFYLMPSTAFVRADYAEMLRVTQPAANENGRNDTAKLGIMVVDVYPDTIVPQFIRTASPPGMENPHCAPRDWPQLPPAAGALPSLGIDLRHSWTEEHEIPYSSMLDEFGRKRARNDYPILALWEMGVRRLRVPLHDLLRPGSRARMEAMASVGTRFLAFSMGVPSGAQLDQIGLHQHLLEGLEIVLRWPPTEQALAQVKDLKAVLPLRLSVSRFWNASGRSGDGNQIKLLVDHGFTPADPELSQLAALARAGVLDSAVFRIAQTVPARDGIRLAVEAAQGAGLRAQVHIRLADDSPARAAMDEWANAARTLEAAICSHFYREHWVFLDTLEDVDRGYFPRIGLIDRLCNPRSAARMLRNLNGALSELGELTALSWTQDEAGSQAMAATNGARVLLHIPMRGADPWQITLPVEFAGRRVRQLDLDSGQMEAFDFIASPVEGRGAGLFIAL